MGNGVSCFNPNASNGPVKLMFHDGSTKLLTKKQMAGELMVQFPDSAICPADEFYLGHRIPVLAIDDDLLPGKLYLVVPLHRLPPGNNLTAASLVSLLSPGPNKVSLAASGEPQPFEYLKGVDGNTVIRVLPEFIAKAIAKASDKGRDDKNADDGGANLICSTPELKKQYELLVSPKNRPWSPGLETIKETKRRTMLLSEGRFSPVRLLWPEKK